MVVSRGQQRTWNTSRRRGISTPTDRGRHHQHEPRLRAAMIALGSARQMKDFGCLSAAPSGNRAAGAPPAAHPRPCIDDAGHGDAAAAVIGRPAYGARGGPRAIDDGHLASRRPHQAELAAAEPAIVRRRFPPRRRSARRHWRTRAFARSLAAVGRFGWDCRRPDVASPSQLRPCLTKRNG